MCPNGSASGGWSSGGRVEPRIGNPRLKLKSALRRLNEPRIGNPRLRLTSARSAEPFGYAQDRLTTKPQAFE
jgi:hypothetical protein